MRLTLVGEKSLGQDVALLAVLVDKGKPRELPGGELGKRAARLVARGVFDGEAGKTLVVHSEGGKGPKALMLVGLGARREIDDRARRRAGAQVVATGASLEATKVVVAAAGKLTLDEESLAQVGQGAMLGAYRYPLKKSESKPPREVAFVAQGLKGARSLLQTVQAVGEGTNLARELGDLPGNVCTPTYLKQRGEKVARSGKLRFRALDKRTLQRRKMGGILAVNQGSSEPPWIFEMEYRPAKYKHTICVVGKGLTFDSGGISIKPAAGMEDMKYDMCGGAATVGLMHAIAKTRPKNVRVIGIVGTTENMSGSSAYKPGDVITTGSGKTIEVINTDAEGRVVLADALHLATEHEPDAIIDMATLTGAIVVALGHERAGLFTRDDDLGERLREAGCRSGEELWPMPTHQDYSDKIKSTWGDIKNSAGRDGGSCTAAAFLFEFTGGVPHAHLDIAGAAWGQLALDPSLGKGASGFGVRVLHDAINNW